MAAEISSLLKHGWAILSKTKTVWLFSLLTLIEPVLRLIIPIQKSAGLSSSFPNFVISLASLYFMIISYTGMSFAAYCIAIGTPVTVRAAFSVAQQLFWRIAGLLFVLSVFSIPFVCIIAFSF
jgi:hypothetical protein